MPAGAYRQIRLRLVPNQPPTGEPVPEENGCGRVGFNCVVTADGTIRALALGTAAAELRIATEQIVGGSFLVLPDTSSDLAIELDTRSSLALLAGDAVQLIPVFAVVPRGLCQSLGASER